MIEETEPTCIEEGEKIYECTECGYTMGTVIEATGHSYTASVVAPTCTEQGYTLHTCTNCGDSYKDSYTNAMGHKYTETVIAPTESAQGYTLHTCSVCGHSYKDNYTNKLLVNTTTLSAENIKLGSYITVNASATGGAAPYQYAYVAQAPDGKWYVLKNYSTDSTHTWKPASTGKYTVQVKVKDSAGTVKIKNFNLTVSA